WAGKQQGDKMFQGWNSTMGSGPYHTHSRWAGTSQPGSTLTGRTLAQAVFGAVDIKAYLRVTSAFSERSQSQALVSWHASDVSSPGSPKVTSKKLSAGGSHEMYLGDAGSNYIKDNPSS